MSIEYGSAFTEQVLGSSLENSLEYHLQFNVDEASSEAVDRLQGMWPVHRDRWLGQYGLKTSLEPNERGNEQLVVRDQHRNVAARLPAGLGPSIERMWLQTNPSLAAVRQTVDERFNENIALLPELKPDVPTPAERIRQTRLSKIAVSVAAFAMMHFGRQ